MVESLKEAETERILDNLLEQGADEARLNKVLPKRRLAQGFYDCAQYLMWLRGMRDCGVELVILADEAEGLRALQLARQDFERDHPCCPRCSTRQFSTTALFCRNRACRMEFKKGH